MSNLRLFFAVFLTSAGSVFSQPAVPGHERLLTREGEDGALKRGTILLSELNCTSCHHPSEEIKRRLQSKSAPILNGVGERVTPQYIRQYLNDPQSVKPGTPMPNIFHSSDRQAKEMAIDLLTHFLVSQGGPIGPSEMGGNEYLVGKGRELYHTVGCVACHAPEDSNNLATPIVPLGNLALKTTVDKLSAFLLNPLHTRPSGRMPNLWLEDEEARALAVYLLRDQLKNPQSEQAETPNQPGIGFEYYELDGLGRLPDFTRLTPVAEGTTDRITLELPIAMRSDNFAVRFRGLIKVPENGNYRFMTRSDDGSALYIDGSKVVDNDGVHGMSPKDGVVRLTKGTHALVVVYFEAAGGSELEVGWAGPGLPGNGQLIPPEVLLTSGGLAMVPLQNSDFSVNPQKASAGARLFSAMRCAACHELNGMRPLVPAKPLAELDPIAINGCLSTTPKKGIPDYSFTDNQRDDLRAALNRLDDLAEEASPAEAVNHALATLNCYACHERKGVGGPNTARAQFFQATMTIDLGEEATLPPRLNHAGAKLKSEALHRILVDGELHVRHYMATRMPGFGEKNLQPILKHLSAVDRLDVRPFDPKFSEESWKAGHKLAGVTGLSCIACHKVSGQDAAGIQGIDLATVYDRITPTWFREYLLDPAGLKPGTRMPQFWPDGQSPFPDLLNGDPELQIGAIYNYLSLRDSMPLPKGIQPKGSVGLELVPGGEPIVHRTFMKDVGPRAIVVGFPAKLHAAFDANKVRLAKVWRGRFFDASGVASGRSDAFLGPLGKDVRDLPAGPAFTHLDTPQSPWPQPERTARDVGGVFQGYYFNKNGNPVFRYKLDTVTIEEQPLPVVQPGGAYLTRKFHLSSGSPPSKLYFIAAEGRSIEKVGSRQFRVDGSLTVTLRGLPGDQQTHVREQSGRQQLLVPVALRNGETEFEVDWQW